MEINNKDYKKIETFFSKKNKDENIEFEIRFNTKDYNINYSVFKKVLYKLIFDEEHGGLNFTNYELNTILSINIDKERIDILDNNDIKKYWLSNKLEEKTNYMMINKERLENIDNDEYNLRFMLSNEKKVNKSLDNINELLNNDSKKYYRLKNRYCIYDNSGDYRFDLTTVKSGNGTTFKNSKTLNSSINYEIEIEYIGKKEKKIDKLMNYIFIIIENIQNNTLKQSLLNKIKENYFELIGLTNNNNNNNGNYQYENKKNFIVGNAVTLHRQNIIKGDTKNIYDKYGVTLKADGERHLLYVYNDEFYLIDINFKIKVMNIKDKNWNNSLIEGELVNSDTFLVYDILFENGNDIRRKQFKSIKKNNEDRYSYLTQFINSKSIIKNEKSLNIELKKYLFSVNADGSDIFEKASELWNNRKYNNYDVDGLIFTPLLEYYPIKSGSWYTLFKWKPKTLNSIDFLVKIQKNKNGIEEKKILICKNNNNELKQYKTLDLYVGGIEHNNYIPIKFNYNNQEEYSISNILLNNDKLLINTENGIETIEDDSIVEFIFDENKEKGFQWIPIKIRHDKTLLYKNGQKVYGNYDKIAIDIFRSIINPVTEEMISTGVVESMGVYNYYENKSYNSNNRLVYQNFHNHSVKDLIFSYISKENKEISGKLLDLASGKGGDVKRWKKYKFAECVGLDNDLMNIQYAKDLFDSISRPKPKTTFIHANISKLIFPTQEAGLSDSAKLRLRTNIPSKEYFDVVSIFFALHYFYSDEITFKILLQNIVDNIKLGGYFIGTCFDGLKVYNILKKQDNIKGDFFEIKKQYKMGTFSKDKPNYGKKIDVYIKSIGKVHSEYLVNINYLESILEKYGFEKVEIGDFETIYNMEINKKDKNKEYLKSMSETEKTFSYLNKYFIFKKIKETPPLLYKKLLSNIKKNNSIIVKNNLESNNENNENNKNNENNE